MSNLNSNALRKCQQRQKPTTLNRRTCHEQNRSIIYDNFMPTLRERKKAENKLKIIYVCRAAASDIGRIKRPKLNMHAMHIST